MIYKLITPSDPITFLADDPKIAIAASLLLGNGKAGCKNEKGESLPTMYLFHPDPLPEIEKDLGCSLDSFLESNRHKLSECFLSFAYGDIEDRRQYDDAIQAITDPLELEKFKAKHEDRNRSSMSQWVKSAWSIGKKLAS